MRDSTQTFTSSTPPRDVRAALASLEEVAGLPRGWDGHDAPPIDRLIVASARKLLLDLPDVAALAPKIVPMTRGRLQFEWHRGNRSLELEFETPSLLHFLKWDPDRLIDEEDQVPAADLAAVFDLLRWFSSEPSDA